MQQFEGMQKKKLKIPAKYTSATLPALLCSCHPCRSTIDNIEWREIKANAIFAPACVAGTKSDPLIHSFIDRDYYLPSSTSSTSSTATDDATTGHDKTI